MILEHNTDYEGFHVLEFAPTGRNIVMAGFTVSPDGVVTGQCINMDGIDDPTNPITLDGQCVVRCEKITEARMQFMRNMSARQLRVQELNAVVQLHSLEGQMAQLQQAQRAEQPAEVVRKGPKMAVPPPS